MRHILKGPEPASLTAWKAPLTTVPDWDDFTENSPGVKRSLKAALLREQFHVCCYCERLVTNRDSHIEHLLPKSSNQSMTYDYSNLLASCEGEKGKGRAPETCGHLKDNNPLPVHPLMPNCSSYFIFSSSGNVTPSMDATKHLPAQTSIATLGLDSASIVNLRRVAMRDVDARLPPMGNGSPAEIANFRAAVAKMITQCSIPDAAGRLTNFSTALVQYLKMYLQP